MVEEKKLIRVVGTAITALKNLVLRECLKTGVRKECLGCLNREKDDIGYTHET